MHYMPENRHKIDGMNNMMEGIIYSITDLTKKKIFNIFIARSQAQNIKLLPKSHIFIQYMPENLLKVDKMHIGM